VSRKEYSFIEVCDIQGGTQPPKDEFVYEKKEGYIRLLQIQDFKREDKTVYIKDRHTLKKCNDDDILIGRYGASIGKILSGLSGAYNVALVKAIPDLKKINKRFLWHFLNSEVFQEFIKNVSTRAAQAGFNKDDLAKLKIYLPSLNEQVKIASVLDVSDAIRKKREQTIKLADDFLRATYLEMFGTPAHNTHHFPKGTIRDLVNSVNYGTSAKASVDSGEYPVLRMGNITYQGGWDFTDLKYIDLSVKEKDKFLVKEGDLLFNRTNSKELVGKTAVYEEERPMAFAGYLIRVRPNPIGNNYYISGYLNSTHGKITLMNMCKSIVGMANINAQELQNIEILIPPKHLQDEYEIIYKKVKKGLSIYDKSAMQLQLLASNLSNKYFM